MTKNYPVLIVTTNQALLSSSQPRVVTKAVNLWDRPIAGDLVKVEGIYYKVHHLVPTLGGTSIVLSGEVEVNELSIFDEGYNIRFVESGNWLVGTVNVPDAPTSMMLDECPHSGDILAVRGAYYKVDHTELSEHGTVVVLSSREVTLLGMPVR